MISNCLDRLQCVAMRDLNSYCSLNAESLCCFFEGCLSGNRLILNGLWLCAIEEGNALLGRWRSDRSRSSLFVGLVFVEIGVCFGIFSPVLSVVVLR